MDIQIKKPHESTRLIILKCGFFRVKSMMPISTLYIAPLIFTLLTDFLSTVKRTGQTTNKTINNK